MNEFEENKYCEIKEELLNNEVEKVVSKYIVNRNELSRYFNVGKLIIEAQGGESRAKYGDNLIKKYSERLTREIGRGYSTRNLKFMRKFYLFLKGQTLSAQSLNISWSHIIELLPFDNTYEINYYLDITSRYHLGVRELRNKIKNKEYQRLPIEVRSKIITKGVSKVTDYIKNPVIVNTYGNNKIDITEKILKEYILRDMDNFLKELGVGFSYIGHEVGIKVGENNHYIDFLLFNYKYNCFVVVEIKVVKLKSEFIGQIQAYMNYVDKNMKSSFNDKTVGVIICKRDDKYVMEYCSDDRIFSTTYELINK